MRGGRRGLARPPELVVAPAGPGPHNEGGLWGCLEEGEAPRGPGLGFHPHQAGSPAPLRGRHDCPVFWFRGAGLVSVPQDQSPFPTLHREGRWAKGQVRSGSGWPPLKGVLPWSLHANWPRAVGLVVPAVTCRLAAVGTQCSSSSPHPTVLSFTCQALPPCWGAHSGCFQDTKLL